MVSSIWIKVTRCLCKAQETPNPKLPRFAHISFLGFRRNTITMSVMLLLNMHNFYFLSTNDIVERCMGAIFAVSTYFLLPLSQHRKGGPWKTLWFFLLQRKGSRFTIYKHCGPYCNALLQLEIPILWLILLFAGQNSHAFPETFVFI